MKKIYFIVVLGILGITYSCTYNEFVIEELPPIDTTIVISFIDTIQPIFDSKCVKCHGSAGGLNLEAGNSYANIVPDRINEGIHEESLIYKKSDPAGTDSHSTKYSAEEAQLVLLWIEQGAENN